MIEVKELRKSYGPTVAVDGISFSVQKGEIVGLLGPNGAGKSTTIRMMTTYLAPDSGMIRVGDVDVEEDPIGVRRLLGYMPESAPLYHQMRVLDYLRFVAEARRDPTATWDRDHQIAWAVEKCGLEEVLKKSIGALSKGFRQRVALAQAILHDPQILILDEPTSGLDPNQILEIRHLIQALGKEKTVFLSTHILQEVSAVCHRAIVIHRGRIAADGTLADLAKNAGSKDTVTARLAGRDDASEMERSLKALPGVQAVTDLGGDGWRRYRVEGDGTGELGEAIFDLSSRRGWRLSELAPERVTIEEIFHQLTEEA